MSMPSVCVCVYVCFLCVLCIWSSDSDVYVTGNIIIISSSCLQVFSLGAKWLCLAVWLCDQWCHIISLWCMYDMNDRMANEAIQHPIILFILIAYCTHTQSLSAESTFLPAMSMESRDHFHHVQFASAHGVLSNKRRAAPSFECVFVSVSICSIRDHSKWPLCDVTCYCH